MTLCWKEVKVIKNEIEFPRMIYMITHIATGKKYIGSSYNPKQRFEHHMNCLKKGNHSVEDMQQDYDENGKDFIMEILDFSNKVNPLQEYQYMEGEETYKREKGYNYKDKGFQKYFCQNNKDFSSKTAERKETEDMVKLLKSLGEQQLLTCYGFAIGLKALL